MIAQKGCFLDVDTTVGVRIRVWVEIFVWNGKKCLHAQRVRPTQVGLKMQQAAWGDAEEPAALGMGAKALMSM